MPSARIGQCHATRPAWSMLLCCAVLVGCAAVPSQEMSDARQALDAAREARAGERAPAAMARADAALVDASEALRYGRYEHARRRATAAREAAIQARELATRLAAAEAGIAAARDAGRPWQGARDLLDSARAVSRTGNTLRAIAIARRAEALLE